MATPVQSFACAALLALGAALASGAPAQPGTTAQPGIAAQPGATAPSDKASHWPGRPVTLVVPYPPGGTSDIVGRQLADRLREELGQTIVVENKAGAATAIGATAVAHAAKDGHTLLLSAGSTFTVIPHLNDKLQYKLDDFAPVAPVCTAPFAFVVRKDFPARDLREFVAYAKAHPGKVNNATNGQGSLVHLLGELVATGLGVQLTQVHYKGAMPASMDLIGGIVDSTTEALTNAVPNINAGQYRALAVLSAEREPLLPQVPTFKELGYPQIVGETWYAVFAPAGTPKPVLDKLGAAIRKITGSARFGAAMRKVGNQAQTGTPEQLRELTLQQSRRWEGLIRQHGIKAE
ncbi:Bug family tripartite tricarboxylate transporter substrate binding protein [Verminephrobacter eiseniae]|uniref:Bug family tripartite tricarboxylate transporter substrate binding protein n=1 Tax=Verminephrobacter eiseniae TaxID=364317 RepID=UPI0022389673|nr:tripartite tricarboxylate transporter substrate binding protein [Verminephrobacter eiseniae]MCW5232969.1 tripartite tricarboxylate transporter substrate binding protein [Verminephrobacter eiseniae]MCW5295475.1 tripartite tricarboxylate transporter substrate binding protein [Verminephrobacter eiseniae]MCW8187452.1 tripartite tricarboxylate transporter substrate binding protein [Verminephrobacter eiseniae]MCW8225782.1 tripartite tricarboxylate transporter substrate binding protein [Verminephro